MTVAGPWTRVILLTPSAEGIAISDALQRQFTARDWFPIHVGDPYAALTELCLRDKAQATRASWGLQRLEQLALVVSQPGAWSNIAELAEAVHKYVPHASVWIAHDDDVHPFDPTGANGSFSQESRASDLQFGETPQVASVDTASSTVSPHEAPSNDDLARSQQTHADTGAHQPVNNSDLEADWQRITREEIDMLLEFDAQDPSGGTPQRGMKG